MKRIIFTLAALVLFRQLPAETTNVILSNTGEPARKDRSAEVATVSVSNAVDLALRNNLQYMQSKQDVRIAELQANESFADLVMPTVSASAGFTYLDTNTVQGGITATGPYTLTNAFQDNYTMGVSASKVLFSGLKLFNSWNIKLANLDLAKRKLEDQRRSIVTSVQTSFYNIFLLLENVKLTEDLDKSLKDRLDYVRANYNAGLAAQLDLIRADVQYKNNQPTLSSIRNAYSIARRNFCDSIGIKDYDNTEFAGNLLDATNIGMVDLPEDRIVEQALSNDINLATIDYNMQATGLSKVIALGNNSPTLSTYFNYNYVYKKLSTTNLSIDRNWVNNWTFGLTLSIPIDGWVPISRNWNSFAEMDATIEKLKQSRQQTMDGIRTQVKSLLLQIGQSRQTIAGQTDNVKQAKLGYALENQSYRAGTASALELSDAQLSLNQAQTSYYQAIYSYYSSVLQLKKLIGQL
jgi:outer membrane protein